MSMYMNFFLRGKDRFYPITTYSRSAMVYSVFSRTFGSGRLWEKVAPITEDKLNLMLREISDDIRKNQDVIKSYEKYIDIIKTMSNSAEEKMELINNCLGMIEEYEEEIRDLRYTRTFITFLNDMIDEVRWSDEEDGFNPDEYIYVGIEISNPTEEDISVA